MIRKHGKRAAVSSSSNPYVAGGASVNGPVAGGAGAGAGGAVGVATGAAAVAGAPTSTARGETDLRRLSRVELLEILVEQGREIDRLRAELAEAEQQLADRQIVLSEAGSIAEAALQLNGIFEAAQAASQQYIDSVAALYARQVQAAQPYGAGSAQVPGAASPQPVSYAQQAQPYGAASAQSAYASASQPAAGASAYAPASQPAAAPAQSAAGRHYAAPAHAARGESRS